MTTLFDLVSLYLSTNQYNRIRNRDGGSFPNRIVQLFDSGSIIATLVLLWVARFLDLVRKLVCSSMFVLLASGKVVATSARTGTSSAREIEVLVIGFLLNPRDTIEETNAHKVVRHSVCILAFSKNLDSSFSVTPSPIFC
jgi:hypothetical protein